MLQKVIIPIAGLGTRFLPISRVIPKEFLPLGDKPLLHHILQEVKDSSLSRCIFVVRPGQEKYITAYFSSTNRIEKFLRVKRRDHLVESLKSILELREALSFSFVSQERPSGDASAVLLALRHIGEESCAVLFPDDIIVSRTPALAQLVRVWRTSGKPVIALSKVGRGEVSQYGVVDTERIASRLHKIKRITEKPLLQDMPLRSTFPAVVGRYVLTPEVFEYLRRLGEPVLKKSARNVKEFVLAHVFETMLGDGKTLYGYELEGEWLECGTKEKWMRSFISYLMRHSEQRNEMRKYMREIL